ncbi:hypothetical protein [Pseudomonas leptonychotis]|nr:hypothetical protein [Pseudomonas leptonychotis]
MQTDHQPTARETFTSLAASGLALALMITAGYLTPDLLALLGK